MDVGVITSNTYFPTLNLKIKNIHSKVTEAPQYHIWFKHSTQLSEVKSKHSTRIAKTPVRLLPSSVVCDKHANAMVFFE